MGPSLSERGRAYALLARLISTGPSPRLIAAAALEPRMARAIAGYGGDLEALAVDHEHVFGFCCPPFESALLGPESTIAGALAEGPGGEAVDHLATELYTLALYAAVDDAGRARQLLDAHLLRWLPSYAAAVRRVDRAWPSALLDTIEDVVLQHRSVLGASDPDDLEFELPPLAISLDDPETGLSEIARALARPARAGCLVTRDDIARLGRRNATPRGFGDRQTLLENLLTSGAGLGSIADVLGDLIVLFGDARADLQSERLVDVPHALRSPWQARIGETCALLAELRQAAGA